MELRNLLFVLVYNYVFSNIKHVQAKANCSLYWDYLASGPRGVADHHLSESSSYSNICKARYGRLYTENHSWAPNPADNKPYIQVEFLKLKIVRGVVTQGTSASGIFQWVTSYSVLYSTDNINWSMAKTKNNSETFQGNSDKNTTKFNFFSECVEAKYIRIMPKTCYSYYAMRFDVLGSTKLEAVNTNWKRHLISLNPNEIDRLSPISNVPSANLGVCGIKCYQHPKCLSYMFDSVRDNCEIYERQIFQGNMVDIDHLGQKYFVNTAFLKNHEYEIDETANICYKIYTWRSTSGQASECCENEKANLISVRNSAMMKALQESVRNNTILSTDPVFRVDGSYSNGTWSHHDGEEIPNTLWAENEPKSSKDNLTCVALTLSGLSVVDCTKRHGFVCGV